MKPVSQFRSPWRPIFGNTLACSVQLNKILCIQRRQMTSSRQLLFRTLRLFVAFCIAHWTDQQRGRSALAGLYYVIVHHVFGHKLSHLSVLLQSEIGAMTCNPGVQACSRLLVLLLPWPLRWWQNLLQNRSYNCLNGAKV